MNEQIVFAGGCFWCTEAVFQRLQGVISVASGYTGGSIKTPAYREVCTGRTGHAEGVLITYDPNQISLNTLLEVFFSTHDPTTMNRQGNDVGTQYRSEIFYSTEDQMQTALDFISLLEKEKVFHAPIVTQVTRLEEFYHAESDHQNYYNTNSEQAYCAFVISPKIEKLHKYFTNHLKKD